MEQSRVVGGKSFEAQLGDFKDRHASMWEQYQFPNVKHRYTTIKTGARARRSSGGPRQSGKDGGLARCVPGGWWICMIFDLLSGLDNMIAADALCQVAGFMRSLWHCPKAKSPVDSLAAL